jgi:hypothetical protein
LQLELVTLQTQFERGDGLVELAKMQCLIHEHGILVCLIRKTMGIVYDLVGHHNDLNMFIVFQTDSGVSVILVCVILS